MTVATGWSGVSSATSRREAIRRTAEPLVQYTVGPPDTTGVVEINMSWDFDGSVVLSQQEYDTDVYTPVDSDDLDTSTPGELVWKEYYGDPATATLRYDASQDRSQRFPEYQYFAVTDDWGLVAPLFDGDGYYKYDESPVDIQTKRVVSAEGPGTAGSEIVYVGEYDDYETSVNDESLRLVVPAHVTVDGPALLARAARASERLAMGGSVTEKPVSLPQFVYNNPEVTIFVVSDPIEKSGLTNNTDCLVHEDATDPGWMTLIHEYVHTQQLYLATSTLKWTIEASADYFCGRFNWLDGSITYENFRAITLEHSESYTDVALADERTWKGTLADYKKGASVLAALDAKIQTATGNREKLGTVFERLNAVDEGGLTGRRFQEITENVAETDLTQFFESYVRGEETPPVPTADELTRLTADFTVNPADFNVETELTLDASVSTPEPDDDIDRYDWVLGDETTQTGQTVSHTYDKPGEYDVILDVKSGEKIGRHTESIIILAVEIGLEEPTHGFKVGDELSMTASITPPTKVKRYELDFDDGTTRTVKQVNPYVWEFDDGTTQTDRNPVSRHTYDDPGVYDVKLEAMTETGTATALRQITIEEALDPESDTNQSTEATDDTSDRSTEATDDTPDRSTEATETELSDNTPGFGVGTAVAAVSGAVHFLRRRLDDESERSESE